MISRRNSDLPRTAVSARSHTFLQFTWHGNRHSRGLQGTSARAMAPICVHRATRTPPDIAPRYIRSRGDLFMSGAPQRQQLASERTPLTSFAPAPSTVSCVPLTRNLSPADPSPFPWPGLATPLRGQQHAALLRIRSTANLRFAGRIPSIHTPIRKITLIGYRDKQATVKRKGGGSREPPAVLVL